MKVTLKLDNRKSPSLKLMISVGTKTRLISLGVILDCPEQWDGKQVINRPDSKALNSLLQSKLALAQNAVIELEQKGKYDCADAVKAIRCRICPEVAEAAQADERKKHSVLTVWREKMATTTGRNWEIYETSLKRLREYVGSYSKDPDIELSLMQFDSITRQWLDKWVMFMASNGAGVNTRSIYLRCLRAVCMYAWRYDHTQTYIFKAYPIERKEGDVEPLTAEEFRKLFTSECDASVAMYRDIALIGFGLIGINVVDMASVTWEDVRNGYLIYERAKTHRRYKIKIEPEILSLIQKYKGSNHIFGWADRYHDYKSFMQHLNDEGLQRVGPVETDGKYKRYRPIFPHLTYYQLRHTWACFAADLDIPKDVIALCLGHGKKTVTDVYVRYDQRKIDEANRKVLDYAFGLITK